MLMLLTGFNYDFGSVDSEKPNELNEAFSAIFRGGQINLLTILIARFSFLHHIMVSVCIIS
jgi:hypothetical protein